MSNDEFNAKLSTWFDGVVAMYADYMDKTFPTNPRDVFELTYGKRYIKVVRGLPVGDKIEHRSVWGFVDRTNGDVLKAAGWSKPAKHARGNIFDEHNGLSMVGPYGPAYLR